MLDIKPINLLKGSHADTGTTGQGCFMNVIAYLNGESQITDESPCVCPTIRPIAIWANDFAGDEQRQRLLPFVLRALGSATEDETEMSRRLTAVVRYAEFNARLADRFAKKAAEAAEARATAWSAEAARAAARARAEAEAAARAVAAWSAAAARAARAARAKRTAAAAEAAAWSAEAAWSARAAAEAAARAAARAAAGAESYEFDQEILFQAALDFLDQICPPLKQHDQNILQRAEELIALNA